MICGSIEPPQVCMGDDILAERGCENFRILRFWNEGCQSSISCSCSWTLCNNFTCMNSRTSVDFIMMISWWWHRSWMLITGVWVCGGGWAIPHSSQWHWPLPQQGGVEPRLIIINIFFNLLIKTLLIDAFLNLKFYQHFCWNLELRGFIGSPGWESWKRHHQSRTWPEKIHWVRDAGSVEDVDVVVVVICAAANIIFLESPTGVGFSYSNISSENKVGGDNRTGK